VVNELTGKVAIVTGGASGIGAGIVEKFVSEGARVVIGDIDRNRGRALADALGARALFQHADTADPGQVGELVSFAVQQFGGLDVMVNNAGISSRMHRSFLEDDLADFGRVMAVNVLGVMAGTRDAARWMVPGGGSIINMSSIGGIQAGGGVMTYRASKAAVIQFSKSASIELAYHDIRVNCIARAISPHRSWRRRRPARRARSSSVSSGRCASRCGPTGRCSGKARPRTWPRPRCTSPASDPAMSPGRCCASTGDCGRQGDAAPREGLNQSLDLMLAEGVDWAT
jgi:NAD(P)-dependent dehydrogenase (short-subunit alcohol dehydrogenase family)